MIFPFRSETDFPISDNDKGEIVYLEAPSFEYLLKFYDEHGLYPCSEDDLESNAAITKLKSAFAIIDLVKPAHFCITKLVRSIQVLKQEDEEVDVSYSHPKIPFSIFVSVCQDNSMLSNLRVAESILHEAMHLKLTLIENVMPLVKPNTGNLYFSPWREEKRPAQGVLHGAFVFCAILHFCKLILSNLKSLNEINYVLFRIQQISDEIKQLKDFHLCDDLTTDGAILIKNLLPLN